MKKAAVAVVASPAIGNLVPAVEFAVHLSKRHSRLSVTVIVVTIPQRTLVEDYVHTRATTFGDEEGVRLLHIPPVDPPLPGEYQSSIGYISLSIEKHIPHVRHALERVAPAESSSVRLAGIFVDMFCTPLIDVACELGVPCYLFFASPASFLGFTLCIPSLHESQNSETELNIPSFANPVPASVLPSFYRRRTEDAYSWFLTHARRYRETKGIFVNTFLALEPHALDSLSSAASFLSDHLPPVYPIGPLIDHLGPARWSPNRSSLERAVEWLGSQPPSSVVFLCFGSMGSLSGAQVKEIAVGLERTGCRFLWSVREPPKEKLDLPSDCESLEAMLPNGFLERTAGIGLVCGWVPQVTILAHGAVGGFVSHCGWNSILESLWYGVPVATWPLYAEQQMNAFQMVVELKLAVEIRLDYGEGSDVVPAEEVESGVRRLMDGNDGVRKRVKEMSKAGKKALMPDGSSLLALDRVVGDILGTDDVQ